MKLNIKEIKYIRQSLEHRLIYYQSKPQYSQYAEELKPIIKKLLLIITTIRKRGNLLENRRAELVNLKNGCLKK